MNTHTHKQTLDSGNVLGAKPYQIGLPKCRNFGMSDSAKYPGLCKQQYNNDVVNEYVDLEFNSINAQRRNSAPQYTYKTYNSEYDNKRMLGSSSSTSNVVPFYGNQQHQRTQQNNYNKNIKIANNELHSFVKRQQQSPYHQQQYGRNQATAPPTIVAERQQSHQTTPFLQAYHQYLQQNTERRPIDKNNPYQTYRWNQLFKSTV